jgi:hypothetical protein
MSLVVARCVGATIVIVGDTHLTDPTKTGPRSLLQGVVKTRMLTDELAISFAGSIRWVEIAFRALDNLLPVTVDRVTETLVQVHRDSSGLAEFIVASANPVELIEIKSGEAIAKSASWLGSEPGFERFQGYATGAVKAPLGRANTFSWQIQRLPEESSGSQPDQASTSRFGLLAESMRQVIEDADCPDVGGFVVPVALHKARFEFMDYAAIVTHPLRLDLMPKSFVVPFGTAQEGGHAINLMSDLQSSTKGVSLYALQGRCGAAFVPQDGLLRPVVLRNKSPIEFEEALAAELGLDMGTFYGHPREYCARAMKRLHEGDLAGALIEAERAIARSDKDASGFDCRGIVRAALGQLSGATEDFNRALSIDPANHRTWANRGLARGRMGDFKGAMEDLDQAFSVKPTYAFAYRMRATVWRALGEIHHAHQDEAEADRLDGAASRPRTDS